MQQNLCNSCVSNGGTRCTQDVSGYPLRGACGIYTPVKNMQASPLPAIVSPPVVSTPPPVVQQRQPIVRVVSSSNPQRAIRYCKLP